jgi:hypothetical protein
VLLVHELGGSLGDSGTTTSHSWYYYMRKIWGHPFHL